MQFGFIELVFLAGLAYFVYRTVKPHVDSKLKNENGEKNGK